MSARDEIKSALVAYGRDKPSDVVTVLSGQLADAVIAAIRAMPVGNQAELIGGEVEVEPANLAPDGWPAHHRVVGSYSEVPR